MVGWDGLQSLTNHFPSWWLQVYCIGFKEVDHSRLELTACILWSIWKNRNAWHFNSINVPASQVFQRGHAEWLEFHEANKQKVAPARCHGNSNHPSQSQWLSSEMVGYYLISTSSIFRSKPHASSVGILIQNDQKTLV